VHLALRLPAGRCKREQQQRQQQLRLHEQHVRLLLLLLRVVCSFLRVLVSGLAVKLVLLLLVAGATWVIRLTVTLTTLKGS
jgi:hypothetical protein